MGAGRPTCRALKKDGTPCPVRAIDEAGYCFTHHPDRAAERKAAQARGGHNRSNVARSRNAAPARLIPVYTKLEEALVKVEQGTLTPQQGTAMAAIAKALASILQVGELEMRLRELEQGVPPSPRDWRIR
jgi:hypothetical protein